MNSDLDAAHSAVVLPLGFLETAVDYMRHKSVVLEAEKGSIGVVVVEMFDRRLGLDSRAGFDKRSLSSGIEVRDRAGRSTVPWIGKMMFGMAMLVRLPLMVV